MFTDGLMRPYWRMADDILFHKYRLSQTVENHRAQVAKEIDGMADERVLNTPLSDLQAYMVEKWKLDLPVLGAPSIDEGRTKMEVGRYGGRDYGFGGYDDRTVQVDAHRYTLEIPFQGDPDLLFHQGNTFNYNPPRGTVKGNTLTMTLVERDPTAESLNATFDRYLADVQQHIDWLSRDVESWNASIPSVTQTLVAERRAKAEKAGSVVANLKFSVKSRHGQDATYETPVVARRKVVPQLPPARPGAKPEPALSPEAYRAILDTLNQMSLVMERSPHAYATLDEETLRFQFLVPLNANFEGDARAEVFNFGGKTDILITVNGKNIFIAECKFWRGAKSLTATVDQILSYLGWRDTKCAILVFNRNKGFSDVLSQLRATVQQHPQYVSFDGARSETELSFTFKRPDDESRRLTLTILAFDIPADG